MVDIVVDTMADTMVDSDSSPWWTLDTVVNAMVEVTVDVMINVVVDTTLDAQKFSTKTEDRYSWNDSLVFFASLLKIHRGLIRGWVLVY